MNCSYCNGLDTVEEETTRFCACDAPQPFIVEEVPAFVCRLCGDKSYSSETVAELEKIKNGDAGLHTIQPLRVFLFDSWSKGGVQSKPWGFTGRLDRTGLNFVPAETNVTPHAAFYMLGDKFTTTAPKALNQIGIEPLPWVDVCVYLSGQSASEGTHYGVPSPDKELFHIIH